jgi:endonuclease-8
VDPWRAIRELPDPDAIRIIEGVRPRMLRSGTLGPRYAELRVYRRAGRPCLRCGEPIRARGQGDEHRTTYWCPECQR